VWRGTEIVWPRQQIVTFSFLSSFFSFFAKAGDPRLNMVAPAVTASSSIVKRLFLGIVVVVLEVKRVELMGRIPAP
jgi:hypothetical protein